MKLGLVGQTYQAWSLPFDAETCINLFPVINQSGKEVAALYGTPGLAAFSVCGAGAVRGCFPSQNGRGFVVSGSTLYEIDAAGVATSRGSLNQSSGNVSFAENGLQLAICDGATLYMFTYSSDAFAQVTSANLPVCGTVTFIDSYFVVNEVDTGKFFISAQYDGTTWAALDFATAESSPDDLVRVYNALGQLWLLGTHTSEIWTNTGAAAFPFSKIAGGKMEVGIVAPHSIIAVSGSIIWLGEDEYGTGIVYQSSNISPQKISTEAIDLLFQKATNKSEIRSYAYQEQGHIFIVFNGGSLTTSLVYDLTTKLWHERAYLNTEGVYEQHLSSCGMFIFGKFLVGDRNNGNVYNMSMDVYDDNGDAILRERAYTHLIDEGKRIRYNNLEIGFETGVGLQTGQGSDPKVALQLSKDGGQTWSTSFTTSIGAVGKYLTKVMFRRLGVSEQMTFRIRISDPVKVAICGSYLT